MCASDDEIRYSWFWRLALLFSYMNDLFEIRYTDDKNDCGLRSFTSCSVYCSGRLQSHLPTQPASAYISFIPLPLRLAIMVKAQIRSKPRSRGFRFATGHWVRLTIFSGYLIQESVGASFFERNWSELQAFTCAIQNKSANVAANLKSSGSTVYYDAPCNAEWTYVRDMTRKWELIQISSAMLIGRGREAFRMHEILHKNAESAP